MTILRALVLSLLCLGVLPWGAYARHVEVPGRIAVAVASPSVERLPWSCRGASLPGSPCAPDAIPATSEGGAEPQPMTATAPEPLRLRDLYRPPMPLVPPKREG